jgi:hypothetical protein
MHTMKLFMAMLGCRPGNRLTEQHDIFFGIGAAVTALIPDIYAFWPEANGKIHLDAWREVTCVDGHSISVELRNEEKKATSEGVRLFFLNLGGYKPGEFDEFHYKLLVACRNKGEAVAKAKQTAFFKHTGFTGATAHIDDRYGVDVDDIHEIPDILPPAVKERYRLVVTPAAGTWNDELHLGYMPLDRL